MNQIENKTVFITGGSRGIGNAIAKRFATLGAKVAICARNEPSLQTAERELKELSPHILALTCDISNSASVRQCVEKVQSELGTIDILINNAGTYIPESVLETTVETWDQQFNNNLKGPFLVTQAVVPQMIENNSGRIIFISSTIALESPPMNSCYTATKWGTDGFAGCISRELIDSNITIHVLRPGFTDTSIFDSIGKPDWDIDWIDPDEIAGAAEYLCSLPKHAHVPELTYMTTFQRKNY